MLIFRHTETKNYQDEFYVLLIKVLSYKKVGSEHELFRVITDGVEFHKKHLWYDFVSTFFKKNTSEEIGDLAITEYRKKMVGSGLTILDILNQKEEKTKGVYKIKELTDIYFNEQKEAKNNTHRFLWIKGEESLNEFYDYLIETKLILGLDFGDFLKLFSGGEVNRKDKNIIWLPAKLKSKKTGEKNPNKVPLILLIQLLEVNGYLEQRFIEKDTGGYIEQNRKLSNDFNFLLRNTFSSFDNKPLGNLKNSMDTFRMRSQDDDYPEVRDFFK